MRNVNVYAKFAFFVIDYDLRNDLKTKYKSDMKKYVIVIFFLVASLSAFAQKDSVAKKPVSDTVMVISKADMKVFAERFGQLIGKIDHETWMAIMTVFYKEIEGMFLAVDDRYLNRQKK